MFSWIKSALCHMVAHALYFSHNCSRCGCKLAKQSSHSKLYATSGTVKKNRGLKRDVHVCVSKLLEKISLKFAGKTCKRA